MISRAAYRVRQLRRALRPNVTPEDIAAAAERLGPGLFPLFAGMQPADQRHCLDVYKTLLAKNETEPHILAAALIHDAGKGGLAAKHIRTWHRVVYVALPGFVTSWMARFSPGLASLRDHGEKTVRLAREAEAGDFVVKLLEAMETHTSDDPRIQLLLAADDAC
ncbi:MAG TPA: hypothetical protein VMR52_03025 [Dehalococcoidia bacterium]|nr:hypothetical protein [Dehalococcoidia bacterium]